MRKFLDLNGLRIFWEKIMQKLALKVDKVEGKTLTTNDFTDTDKSKLDSLKNYTAGSNITIDSNGVISADVNGEVDTEISTVSENPVQNKAIGLRFASINGELNHLEADKLDASAYVVDDALNPDSDNPLKNKAISALLGGYLRITDTAPSSNTVKQGFSQANSDYPVMMASTTDTTSISDIYGKPLRANSVTINPYSGAVNASKVTAANFIGNLTGNATNADEAVGVKQSYTGINSNFPVMLSTTTDTTSVADVIGTPYRTNAVTINPYSGIVKASEFDGKATSAGSADYAASAGTATSADSADEAVEVTQNYTGSNTNFPVLLSTTTDTTSLSAVTGTPYRTNSVTINPYSGAVNASKVTATTITGNLTGNADSADEAVEVKQSYTGSNSNYPVLLSTTTDTTSVANVVGTPNRTNSVTINPYSGTINASKVTATTFTGDLTGNASSATTAGSSTTSDRASGVIDYTATSSTIQVGYSGSSVTAANASYVAVYTNGAHIKDMTFASLAEKLREQSLLPITYSTSAPGSSLATGTVWLQYES